MKTFLYEISFFFQFIGHLFPKNVYLCSNTSAEYSAMFVITNAVRRMADSLKHKP